MGILNVTNANSGLPYEFRASNAHIHIDTLELKISETEITSQEFFGTF